VRLSRQFYVAQTSILEEKMKTAFVVGRAIFGGFFLYNGINHFLKRKELTQYAGAKNVANPDIAVVLSGLALLFGGTSFIIGKKHRLGAAAIVSFLSAVSPLMHDFWKSPNPEQKMNEMINFTKNMALLGAALAFLGVKES
jgi:uncharacterized membrane protein YphA (DoxX/SURF4 family)